jgi:hypothetical protein
MKAGNLSASQEIDICMIIMSEQATCKIFLHLYHICICSGESSIQLSWSIFGSGNSMYE